MVISKKLPRIVMFCDSLKSSNQQVTLRSCPSHKTLSVVTERVKQPTICESVIVAAVTSNLLCIIVELFLLSIDIMCAPAENVVFGLTN